MKLSLKLKPQDQKAQTDHNQLSPPPPLLLKAKLPITAFSLPFLSSLTLCPSEPPALSLRTNLSSGPSLKFSYTPNTKTSPFMLSLSSGVGVFGSTIDSPIAISAHFGLDPLNPNPSPTFSLMIKPRLGDFSIKKITSSPPDTKKEANCEENGRFGSFVPIERPGSWKDLSLSGTQERNWVSGVSLWARTGLPVTKRVAMRFRWGVNFPSDLRKSLPYLSVDKIEIERVEEVKEGGETKKSGGELEVLKGMCSSVGRELEDLRRENREMRRCLDEMKFGMMFKQDLGSRGGGNGNIGRSSSDVVSKRITKAFPVIEDLGEIEGWNKVKKNGAKDYPVKKEATSNVNRANGLESELQKAIKAASSSQ